MQHRANKILGKFDYKEARRNTKKHFSMVVCA